MLKPGVEVKKVIICCEKTDMRKGIDSLAAIVQLKFELDPLEVGTLFLFCGRSRDRLKGLLFEGDGFTLAYKRLTNGKFQWPQNEDEARRLTREEYERLLEGYTVDSSIKCSRRPQKS